MPNIIMPGDEIKFPARSLGNAYAAGDAYRMNQPANDEANGDSLVGVGTNIVSVFNQTGLALPIGAILQVASPAVVPTANDDDDATATFMERVALNGTLPADDDAPKVFVVTLAPADPDPDTAIPCCISGSCFLRINRTDADHTSAKPVAGDATKLESCGDDDERAAFTIVTPTKGAGVTGEQYCYVRFPLGGAGGASFVLTYSASYGSNGAMNVNPVELLEQTTANPNWTTNTEETIEGFYLRGVTPA